MAKEEQTTKVEEKETKAEDLPGEEDVGDPRETYDVATYFFKRSKSGTKIPTIPPGLLKPVQKK